MKPNHFVLEVDGAMTTGSIFCTAGGNVMKEFRPQDSADGKMLCDMLTIQFVTADKSGFPITQKRIGEYMGYPEVCG